MTQMSQFSQNRKCKENNVNGFLPLLLFSSIVAKYNLKCDF